VPVARHAKWPAGSLDLYDASAAFLYPMTRSRRWWRAVCWNLRFGLPRLHGYCLRVGSAWACKHSGLSRGHTPQGKR